MKTIKTYILPKPRTVLIYDSIVRIEVWEDGDDYMQYSYSSNGKVHKMAMCDIDDVDFGYFMAGDIVDQIEEKDDPPYTNLEVEYYDDNTCGDGCCTGIKIVGRDYADWPNNYRLNIIASGIKEEE